MKTKGELKYYNSYGKENTFLREEYYEEVCAIVADFFEKELIMNNAHKGFITFLNSMENEEDIIFFQRHFDSFIYAMVIIKDMPVEGFFLPPESYGHPFIELDEIIINGKTKEDYIKWWREVYYKKTGIADYFLEPLKEDKYYHINADKHFIFLTKNYYDFVCELVIRFYDKKIKNNIQHSLFLNRLDAIQYYEDSFQEIQSKEPYQWAMSIIKDEEYNEILEGEALEQYQTIKDIFLKKHNITGFVIENDLKN